MVLVEEEGRVAENEAGKPTRHRGKKFLHIIIFFLVFFIAVYIFLQPSVKKGVPAPDFRLPDLNGQEVTLSQFRGKVVFLNFWATWCPPCIEEMPSINALQKKVQSNDFVILTVNIDQTGRENIKKFVDSRGLEFRVLLDPKSDVSAGKYGISGVPETFLIDRNGIVIERYIGPRNWTEEAFITYLNKILNAGK